MGASECLIKTRKKFTRRNQAGVPHGYFNVEAQIMGGRFLNNIDTQ